MIDVMNGMLYRRCIILVFTLTVLVTFRAQAYEEAPGAFAKTVSGARPIGLNDAYVAIADDANAIWWNPAGMSQLKRSIFTSMYTNLYNVDGLSMSSLGFVDVHTKGDRISVFISSVPCILLDA